VEIFSSGTIASEAELLASGQGQLGSQSRLSEDGKLVYNTLVLGGTIYRIPTANHGRKIRSAERFALPEEINCHSPSISWDGRWMVYTTSTPAKANRALLRDLSTGTEQLLDDGVGGPDGGKNSISPDGSTIIVGHDCKLGDCAFLVRRGGSDLEQLCEGCTARGFSSDGALVLIEKYALAGEGRDKIAALDVATKKEKDFLRDPDQPLYQASFSWDDHWVVFKRQFTARSQIMIAPAQNVVSSQPERWIAVTDGSNVDDKPQFSPEGDSVYFLSSRDGHACIWNQRVHPLTKHPIGPPTPYEHRHSLSFDFFRLGRTELSVARNSIIISVPEVVSDLWIKQVE
jgi:Tol biopolymer transport system component